MKKQTLKMLIPLWRRSIQDLEFLKTVRYVDATTFNQQIKVLRWRITRAKSLLKKS